MYDLDIVNKGAFSSSGNRINVMEKANSGSKVIYQTDDFAGILTGNYTFSAPEGTWYQVIALSTNHVYGYVSDRYVTIKSVNPIQYNTAQGIINSMIDQDKRTLSNLLVCAQYCKLLEAKGRNVSDYKGRIKNTYISLYNRNQKLKNSPNFKSKSTGYNNLADFASALTSIVNNPNIGFVFTTGAVIAIIVAAVIAGAGVATAVYYGFGADASKAAKDLNVSDDLRDALAQVDPEVAQRIKDDLNNQIDDAYSEGKRAGLSWWDIIKYGGVAAGTFFLIRYVKNTF